MLACVCGVNEQTQARTTQLIQANGKQNSPKARQAHTCTPRSHTHFHVYPLFSPHLGAVWKYLDTPNIFFGDEVFWNKLNEKKVNKNEQNRTRRHFSNK